MRRRWRAQVHTARPPLDRPTPDKQVLRRVSHSKEPHVPSSRIGTASNHRHDTEAGRPTDTEPRASHVCGTGTNACANERGQRDRENENASRQRAETLRECHTSLHRGDGRLPLSFRSKTRMPRQKQHSGEEKNGSCQSRDPTSKRGFLRNPTTQRLGHLRRMTSRCLRRVRILKVSRGVSKAVVFVEHVFKVLNNLMIWHVENEPHVIDQQPGG